jgi:hypothetical protein
MNSNRQANIGLFTDYIIDEADAKQLLLGLEVNDFSEVRQNDHVGYEHEMLFIFGKDVLLTERFGSTENGNSGKRGQAFRTNGALSPILSVRSTALYR